MARTATGESSLARAVRILDCFTPDEPALPVSEIARRAGLHVATASRLVAELVSHGLLARGPDRAVRIGMRMWELASRASPTLSLREAAMPFLEDLHAVVGHHAQLGIRDGDEVLFVERLTARDAVVNFTRIAVPVRDALGEVVAGLSVIVPNDGRAAAHVPVLLAAARGLSRTLAGTPSGGL
jgi:DNA-binding IclR family transcriptional regulator